MSQAELRSYSSTTLLRDRNIFVPAELNAREEIIPPESGFGTAGE